MKDVILKLLWLVLILILPQKVWVEENPYHYFSQAEKYRTQGNYNKAIEMYKQVLKLKPDDALAYNNLGCSYYEKGMYDEAIEAYKKALEIEHDSKTTHHNLGCAYYNKMMYDEALEEFKKELKHNPDYVDSLTGVACVYYNKGMYEETINWCKKILKIDPQATLAKDKLAGAEKMIKERKAKENYYQWYNSGCEWMNQKKFKQASEDFNKALEYASMGYEKEMIKEKLKEVELCLNNQNRRENYRQYYNLGIEQIEQKKWQEAMENFNKALAYASMGYEKEMIKEKLKEIELCLNNQNRRENYSKYYNLAIAQTEQKKWQEAIENFSKALEYASMGSEKEMVKEKLNEAKRNLSKKEKQENYWKSYTLAMTSFQQKRFKEAIENFNRASQYASSGDEKSRISGKLKEATIALQMKIQHENYQKWYNLGIDRLQQNRFKDAVENFNQALKYTTTENEKTQTKEKLNEANVNWRNETQRRAIVSLKNTLPLNGELTKLNNSQPTTVKPWLSWISFSASLLLIMILLLLLPQFNSLKTKIYLWQKRYYKVASLYENAISKEKKVWLYPALANIYLKLDRMDDEAMKVYDRAIYLNPNNQKILNIVTDYYIKKNKIGERAIEIYEDALKFEPNNILLLNMLGKAYIHQGDDKKAANVYRRLYKLGKKDEIVVRNLCKNYLAENRFDDDAISIYEEGLKYEPNNHDLIIALSQAYINKGRNDKKTVEIYRKSVGLCSNMIKTYRQKNELEKAREYAEIVYKIVSCYSIGIVNTLVRDSVMGVINKWS